MNIIKLLQDRLLGMMTVLTVTGSSVKICQGSKSLVYDLPKTFQRYNYLNHTEEMAGWLLAVLREEKIRIRRCRIVLDTEQVYFQTVKLPAMTVREQQNWVRWEGNRYVPFEPGTYQAVLLPWSEPVDLRAIRDKNTTDFPEFSAEWQATGKAQLNLFLLAAVSRETIEALQEFGSFCMVKLEEVTAIGPDQIALPVNLLPAASRKEKILGQGYKVATVLCLLMSVFLPVRSGIRWQHAKSAWQEADRQLIPLCTVKAAYEESKQADSGIRTYRQMLQHINKAEPVWYSAFWTITGTIPEGCWLDGLHQKQTQSRWLEIQGCALNLAQVTEFLAKLEQSKVFLKIRLVESGTKRIEFKGGGDDNKTVVSFHFLAELAPIRTEGMP